MLTAAHRTLDRVNKSILFKNVAAGVKYRKHCYITKTTIKVPMCGVTAVKNLCRREVQGLCQRWARRGVMVREAAVREQGSAVGDTDVGEHHGMGM